MSRFNELTTPKKNVVIKAAETTVEKLVGPLGATDLTHDDAVDLRARQITNNPFELGEVLGRAGLSTCRNDRSNGERAREYKNNDAGVAR